jgi:inorganic phosphate transporter, PiT family
VILGLAFDDTNGFHDDAMATAVSTRALTPRVALGIAAVTACGYMLGHLILG